jgi:DNA-binding XRE family transcriptional regulator
MEYEVKLNPEGIKRLRESKSWTQEHLASAAGVSLRTIQRMEADGSSSAESRLAVAAAKARTQCLTPRSNGRVKDKVPGSNAGVRAAQLNRQAAVVDQHESPSY